MHTPPLAGLSMMAAGWIAIAGCTQPQASPQTEPATRTPVANRHWLEDEELRKIMADITRQYPMPRDHARTGAKEGDELRKWTSQIAKLAAELRSAAEKIPAVVSSVRMTPADRAAFKAQADTLGDQARILQRAAKKGDVDAMHNAMIDIGTTCASCHARFRDFSGLLENRQTSVDRPEAETLTWNFKP
jgi:hypothetical protein